MYHAPRSLTADQCKRLAQQLGVPRLSRASRDRLTRLSYLVYRDVESDKQWRTAQEIEGIANEIGTHSQALANSLLRMTKEENAAAFQIRMEFQRAFEAEQFEIPISKLPYRLQAIARMAATIPDRLLEPSGPGRPRKYDTFRSVVMTLADVFKGETGREGSGWSSQKIVLRSGSARGKVLEKGDSDAHQQRPRNKASDLRRIPFHGIAGEIRARADAAHSAPVL
jgi:hypothetical protein